MTSAIVLAGGNGSRMKSDLPKQFMLLDGKPLISYALNTFENSEVDEVILVTRDCDIDFCRENIVSKYGLTKVSAIVPGGANRYDSVWSGIQAASKDSDIIMIHDGARPFISQKMISESIACAREEGACTVGMPVKDTIKVVDDNKYGVSTPDRSTLYIVQTPQTFKSTLIIEAYNKMFSGKIENITDDTMIVEKYLDKKVRVIEGSYENIKVTTPEDLVVSLALIHKIK